MFSEKTPPGATLQCYINLSPTSFLFILPRFSHQSSFFVPFSLPLPATYSHSFHLPPNSTLVEGCFYQLRTGSRPFIVSSLHTLSDLHNRFPSPPARHPSTVIFSLKLMSFMLANNSSPPPPARHNYQVWRHLSANTSISLSWLSRYTTA